MDRSNKLPPIAGAASESPTSSTPKGRRKKAMKKKKAELREEFRQSAKKIIVNLKDGADIATGDLRRGMQRDASALKHQDGDASFSSSRDAWGGGNKKGNTMGAVEVSAPSTTPSHLRGGGGKRSTSTATRRKHFHEARDNLYGISETGDEALKKNFKKSILEMRYNRNYFTPEDRAKEKKNTRIDVEKTVEEEIAVTRKRKDYSAYAREVEFGAVWGKACFELGDLLLEGKDGYDALKAAVEDVLKRYFVELKESFRLYSMSASEMVTAEGVRHRDSGANTMGPSEYMVGMTRWTA